MAFGALSVVVEVSGLPPVADADAAVDNLYPFGIVPCAFFLAQGDSVVSGVNHRCCGALRFAFEELVASVAGSRDNAGAELRSGYPRCVVLLEMRAETASMAVQAMVPLPCCAGPPCLGC